MTLYTTGRRDRAVHRVVLHGTSSRRDHGHSNMLGLEDEHAEAFASRGVQQHVRERDDLRRTTASRRCSHTRRVDSLTATSTVSRRRRLPKVEVQKTSETDAESLASSDSA